MIESFQLARIPKINFRCGVISELPGIAKLYGSKIIIVTGKSSFNQSKYAEKLLHDFDVSGIRYHIVTIPGEPSPAIIDETASKFRNEDIKLIVGIGGGSVLDAGKAISAMIQRPESVFEFLEGVGNLLNIGRLIETKS